MELQTPSVDTLIKLYAEWRIPILIVVVALAFKAAQWITGFSFERIFKLVVGELSDLLAAKPTVGAINALGLLLSFGLTLILVISSGKKFLFGAVTDKEIGGIEVVFICVLCMFLLTFLSAFLVSKDK